jgi:hypothetical protein
MGIAEEVAVWRLRSPDGQIKAGKAFPEGMFRRAFLTSYTELRYQQQQERCDDVPGL